MPAIGFVTRSGSTFKGQLRTISVRAEIEISPNTNKTADSQPDFRVTSAGVEVGAGWQRRSEASGNEYVSLTLAAGRIPAQSRCRLPGTRVCYC